MKSPDKPPIRVVLPLRTWLAISHLVVLLLPLLAVVGTGALAWDLRRQTAADIEHQALIVAEVVQSRLEHEPRLDLAVSGMHRLLVNIRSQTLAGFRVVDAQGVVIASSGAGLGDDLSDAPEVAQALHGERAVHSKRRARSTDYAPGGPGRGALVRLFAATPIVIDNHVVGAVIVNRTPREELQALYQMTPRLWLGMLLAIVVTMGLGLVAGYLFSRNLVRMARTSHRIADGSIAGTALMRRPSRSHVRETRDLAVAVNEMADRLQQRVGYIREFAGNVSHEFKTPLSTLRGTMELLADDADMPAEQRARFLQNATAEVDRMGRLVAGLLALARAEERVDHGPVNFDDVLATVGARHPSVTIIGSIGQFKGDAQQLEVAVENLVDNAVRYAKNPRSVQIVCALHPDALHIDVIDDGPGISPANLPLVTQRFFTTERASGGTGLGLALVQAVCAAHGGTVHIDSEPGRTCMRVELPRR